MKIQLSIRKNVNNRPTKVGRLKNYGLKGDLSVVSQDICLLHRFHSENAVDQSDLIMDFDFCDHSNGGLADITGLDILVTSTAEAASAGAATLAAQGCGKNIGSLECAKIFKPSEKKAYYEEKFKKYKLMEKRMWQEEKL